MAKPDFWSDQVRAQKLLQQLNSTREWVDLFDELMQKVEDAEVLVELADEELDSEARTDEERGLINDVEKGLRAAEKMLNQLRLHHMLSGENDKDPAILTIHSGAGGVDSCDWAQMLLRMYLRWSERRGMAVQVLDLQAAEEAGIKDATLEVTGPYAYGFLKAERGVHRLVRLSPFDAAHRRHTSFASVFVYPEVSEEIVVEINERDLRVDTFRASGPGGQHVNKSDTAVRITHIPTGIVVQCQNERSQRQNRINAMKVLRARLYQHYQQKEEEKRSELEKEKDEIAWGRQIRSYVFHPYTMVKDHRTDYQTSNVQAVIDGDLDDFIEAYLMAS